MKKSNELPVFHQLDSVVDAPVISSQVGLKSIESVNGNSPLGAGSSGSILLQYMFEYFHNPFVHQHQNKNLQKEISSTVREKS